MNERSWFEDQDTEGGYGFIEQQLDKVADKICMLEQIENMESALLDVQKILSNTETVARRLENFRISSLARAIQLMTNQMVKQDYNTIPQSTYAFLIYSIRVLIRLAQISNYSFKTGFESHDNSYIEAIGAIIDHTDELTQPHMRN